MKKLIMVPVITACLALCVAMWPQTEAVEETPATSPSGDVVYVPGFGWLESQGFNHVEYAEDMYENGNKIGIMG